MITYYEYEIAYIIYIHRQHMVEVSICGCIYLGHVYSAGKNFTSKINPDVILPVKLKFYWQNKSRSYSAGKT